MRMYDLIHKKKEGKVLSTEEINYFVKGVTDGSIPDCQTSALMMAVCLKGMDDREATDLTLAMLASGESADLSAIPGLKADKHSTGGVGDSTTPVVIPTVASCGLKVAKMSGRALGHTGGTIDKLESVPGTRVELTPEEFANTVNTVGAAVIAQTGTLCPADKKLYALRDFTATVESNALIASSIMSKKLASGADVIMLDVKYGSGAFVKDPEDARELARLMVRIGEGAGRRVGAIISSMDVPLGHAVGNALEMYEASDILCGNAPADKLEVCVELAAGMLKLAGICDIESARKMAKETILSGKAFGKLCEMLEAQGGDTTELRNPEKRRYAPYRYELKAAREGYISFMNTEEIGLAEGMLGAGRTALDGGVDYLAGLEIIKKTGDKVSPDDTVMVLYSSDKALFDAAARRLENAITYSDEKPEVPPVIYATVGI
ncbi:MAG: thymidine phosphorylase [Clostridia bacterium]|nr:thymidine phosphorylase [Clostridia bacterium]MBR0326568.1 thymidine phosphorylase [Clostridia bacterium]